MSSTRRFRSWAASMIPRHCSSVGIRSGSLKIAGEADFQVSGNGAASGVPAMKGGWHLQNVVVNSEAVGTLNGDLSTEKGRLIVRSGSTLSLGRLDLVGSVRLEEPYPLEAKADFTDLDLDSLLQPFLQGGVSTHSVCSGTVTVSGNIRDADGLEAKTTISRVAFGLRGVDFHNQAPIVATYHRQAVTVEPFHLSGKNIELDLSGSLGRPVAGATAARAVSVKVNGHADLALANAVSHHVNAGGQAVLAMTVEGTTENPQVNGRVDLQEGALTLDFFPNSFSRMKGSLLFNKAGIRMERLSGESGGGPVEFTGSMDYSRSPATFELRCQGTGVRTRYPAGVSTMLDTNWVMAGSTSRALLNGQMVINRMGVNPNFDLAPALAQIKQTSILVGDEDWARRLDLQFRVVSAGDVRFDSAKTRNLQAQVDLRVRGTAADLTVLGKIILLGGEVDFAGNHYRINRGEIAFNNPFRVDPELNLDVATRSQQYDIGLDFSGPMDKLHVNYRSDPPLPVSDIQALLFLGRSPSSTFSNTAATNPALQEATTGNTVLQQAMSATSGKGLDRLFGGARLKFDPQSGGIEQNSSAHLTLEQQLTPDVTLTYITSLNNTQQQIVQVEITVSPRLSILAIRDQDGLFGIDLRWKKRFR